MAIFGALVFHKHILFIPLISHCLLDIFQWICWIFSQICNLLHTFRVWNLLLRLGKGGKGGLYIKFKSICLRFKEKGVFLLHFVFHEFLFNCWTHLNGFGGNFPRSHHLAHTVRVLELIAVSYMFYMEKESSGSSSINTFRALIFIY